MRVGHHVVDGFSGSRWRRAFREPADRVRVLATSVVPGTSVAVERSRIALEPAPGTTPARRSPPSPRSHPPVAGPGGSSAHSRRAPTPLRSRAHRHASVSSSASASRAARLDVEAAGGEQQHLRIRGAHRVDVDLHRVRARLARGRRSRPRGARAPGVQCPATNTGSSHSMTATRGRGARAAFSVSCTRRMRADRRGDQRVRFGAPADRVADAAHVVPHSVERRSAERHHCRRDGERRDGAIHLALRQRADLAHRLREQHLRRERGDERRVEREHRRAGRRERAHVGVDRGARTRRGRSRWPSRAAGASRPAG